MSVNVVIRTPSGSKYNVKVAKKRDIVTLQKAFQESVALRQLPAIMGAERFNRLQAVTKEQRKDAIKKRIKSLEVSAAVRRREDEKVAQAKVEVQRKLDAEKASVEESKEKKLIKDAVKLAEQKVKVEKKKEEEVAKKETVNKLTNTVVGELKKGKSAQEIIEELLDPTKKVGVAKEEGKAQKEEQPDKLPENDENPKQERPKPTVIKRGVNNKPFEKEKDKK